MNPDVHCRRVLEEAGVPTGHHHGVNKLNQEGKLSVHHKEHKPQSPRPVPIALSRKHLLGPLQPSIPAPT